MKRFYKAVTVEGRSVLLDGKAIRTPAGAKLVLPTAALAEAIADEWRAQGETIDPATMPVAKLANTAIDVVPGQRAQILDQILAYGRADVVCYRTNIPRDLSRLQAMAWERPVSWLEERYGARLSVRIGTLFIEQPAQALAALERALAARTDFELAALHAAATILGSLALTLMVADGALEADTAFSASRIDETYQAERWGVDAEAQSRARRLAAELDAAARFMDLVRTTNRDRP